MRLVIQTFKDLATAIGATLALFLAIAVICKLLPISGRNVEVGGMEVGAQAESGKDFQNELFKKDPLIYIDLLINDLESQTKSTQRR